MYVHVFNRDSGEFMRFQWFTDINKAICITFYFIKHFLKWLKYDEYAIKVRGNAWRLYRILHMLWWFDHLISSKFLKFLQTILHSAHTLSSAHCLFLKSKRKTSTILSFIGIYLFFLILFCFIFFFPQRKW